MKSIVCLSLHLEPSHPGDHPEIFKGGGFNFSKTNQYPIMVYLFQPLMKMYAVIVKEGFAVIVAFYYSICLFRTPVITTLNVIGCEDCTCENKLPLWESGGKAPSRWAIFAVKYPF